MIPKKSGKIEQAEADLDRLIAKKDPGLIFIHGCLYQATNGSGLTDEQKRALAGLPEVDLSLAKLREYVRALQTECDEAEECRYFQPGSTSSEHKANDVVDDASAATETLLSRELLDRTSRWGLFMGLMRLRYLNSGCASSLMLDKFPMVGKDPFEHILVTRDDAAAVDKLLEESSNPRVSFSLQTSSEDEIGNLGVSYARVADLMAEAAEYERV